MSYLGIDPGQAGGVALLDDSGGVIGAFAMPETPADLVYKLESWKNTIRHACIERVHAMPAKRINKRTGKVIRQGIASTGKFLKGAGILEGILLGLHIPYEDVPAVTWQRYMHCLTRGNKNISKNKAQTLYPQIRVTHSTADALLIAKYAREKHLGILPPPIKVIRQAKQPPVLVSPGHDREDDF